MATTRATSLVEVKCDTTDRLLFRGNVDGIFVWCRGHQRPHFIPWSDLDALREQLQRGELGQSIPLDSKEEQR